MKDNKVELLDIKVGYACNNNCLHCVLKASQYMANKLKVKENFSLSELEKIIKSKQSDTIKTIVITGGEPTIRNDFSEIVNMIFDFHPNIRCEVQTNGRGLKKHLPNIIHHEKLAFDIALHGANEKMHNAVVGTATANRNPFKETTESIEEIIRICGDSSKIAFKIVLNSINFNELQTIVQFIDEKYNAKQMSVAYPHLDGFFYTEDSDITDFKNYCHPHIAKSNLKNGKEISNKIGFSYAEFSNTLKNTIGYIKNRPHMLVALEAIPLCAFNDKGKHYEMPQNVYLQDRPLQTEVHYTNSNTSEFQSLWRDMHVQPDEICQKCLNCKNCCGIWKETYATFGVGGLFPITNNSIL